MFTKQVAGLVDSLDPPIVPRRRSRSSELEERPAPGPNPSFCALQLAGLSPNGSASPECAEASGLAATIPARSNKPMLATAKITAELTEPMTPSHTHGRARAG
jgi:hypothetical protein